MSKKEKILLGVSIGLGVGMIALGINQKKLLRDLQTLNNDLIDNENAINEIVDFVKYLEITVNSIERGE